VVQPAQNKVVLIIVVPKVPNGRVRYPLNVGRRGYEWLAGLGGAEKINSVFAKTLSVFAENVSVFAEYFSIWLMTFSIYFAILDKCSLYRTCTIMVSFKVIYKFEITDLNKKSNAKTKSLELYELHYDFLGLWLLTVHLTRETNYDLK
jgi:hypothetical protein